MTEQLGSNWTPFVVVSQTPSNSETKKSIEAFTALLGGARRNKGNTNKSTNANNENRLTSSTSHIARRVFRQSAMEPAPFVIDEKSQDRSLFSRGRALSNADQFNWKSEKSTAPLSPQEMATKLVVSTAQKVENFTKIREEAKLHPGTTPPSSIEANAKIPQLSANKENQSPRWGEGILDRESQLGRLSLKSSIKNQGVGKKFEHCLIEKNTQNQSVVVKKRAFFLEEAFFKDFYKNFSISRGKVQEAIQEDVQNGMKKVEVLDRAIEQLKGNDSRKIPSRSDETNKTGHLADKMAKEWIRLCNGDVKEAIYQLKALKGVETDFVNNLKAASKELDKAVKTLGKEFDKAFLSEHSKGVIERAKLTEVTAENIKTKTTGFFKEMDKIETGILTRDISRIMFGRETKFLLNRGKEVIEYGKIQDYKLDHNALRIHCGVNFLKAEGHDLGVDPTAEELDRNIQSLSAEKHAEFDKEVVKGVKDVNDTLIALDKFRKHLEYFLSQRHQDPKQVKRVVDYYNSIVRTHLIEQKGRGFDMNFQEKIYTEFIDQIKNLSNRSSNTEIVRSALFFMKSMSQTTGNYVQTCIGCVRGFSKNPMPTFKPLDRIQVLETQDDGSVIFSAQVRCHSPPEDSSDWIMLTVNEAVFSSDLTMTDHNVKAIVYTPAESPNKAKNLQRAKELQSYGIAADIPVIIETVNAAEYAQMKSLHLSTLQSLITT
jgi:hypothetical protein